MKPEKRLSLLCVHQGNELYGSDRVFADSVRALRKSFPSSKIVVILPGPGPIENLIKRSCDVVRYAPLWVLRKNDIKFPEIVRKMAAFPRSVFKTKRLMQDYDLVYINTIVVMNFLVATCLLRKNAIIHVHELVSGILGKLIGAFLRASSATIVCNSHATAASLGLSRFRKCHIIWNGTEIPGAASPPRKKAGQALKVLLPGRLNSWKGQQLLVEAVGAMAPTLRNRLQVRIVGDVYADQHHFRENILERIKVFGLSDHIKLFGFRQDMDEMYRWADVVAVPSTAPEPFGMVAIEAMSHARPVIAARHGGLPEIVSDDCSGWLFPPGDTVALSRLFSMLVSQTDIFERMGIQAHLSAMEKFSKAKYDERIGDLSASLLR